MKDFKERFRETMKKYGVTREKVAVAVVVILAAVLLICLLAILATAIKPLLGLAAGIGVVLLIFTDFWERLFRRLEAAKQPPAPFPVYFGFEDGRIVPHLVDEIFGSLYRRLKPVISQTGVKRKTGWSTPLSACRSRCACGL